jgi:hypothetical protein
MSDFGLTAREVMVTGGLEMLGDPGARTTEGEEASTSTSR